MHFSIIGSPSWGKTTLFTAMSRGVAEQRPEQVERGHYRGAGRARRQDAFLGLGSYTVGILLRETSLGIPVIFLSLLFLSGMYGLFMGYFCTILFTAGNAV